MLRHLCQTLSSIHLMIRKDWDSDFNIYKPNSGISLETQFYLMILICMVIKQTLF